MLITLKQIQSWKRFVKNVVTPTWWVMLMFHCHRLYIVKKYVLLKKYKDYAKPWLFNYMQQRTSFLVLMSTVCNFTFWLCSCFLTFLSEAHFRRMFVRSAQKSCQIMKRRSKASLKSICTPMRRSVMLLLEVVWAIFLFDPDLLITMPTLLSC